MELFKMALFVVLVFLCIYAVVDRICKCVEHCRLGEVYETLIKNNISQEGCCKDDFEKNS